MRLLQYEDNAVYLVDSGRSRHILRLSLHDGRSPDEQRSELFWLEALQVGGTVLAPAPVRTREGGFVVEVEPFGPGQESCTAVLFEWLPGRAGPGLSRPGTAEGLGVLTARLHAHSESLPLPEGFTRPYWDRRAIFDEGYALTGERALPLLGPEGLDVLRAVNARLMRTYPDRGKDWGLIHADLHRGNLIGTPAGEFGVIDFDDCGFGHHMLDLATVLSSYFRTCGGDTEVYADFARRYLDGYRTVRPLPETLDRMEDFLLLRDMIIVNFVTHSQNATVAEYGPGRVGGIIKEMRVWLAGGRYVGSLPGSLR